MIRTMISILLLIGCSSLSVFLLHKPIELSKTKARLKDLIIEEVQDQHYNSLGQLSYQIQASLAYHDPMQKKHFYTSPQITYLKENEQPWILNAKSGYSSANKDTLYFEHDVVIKQAASIHKPSTQIKTDHLAYHLKNKTAQTDDKILIKQDNLEVKSIGATINLETHLVKFLSNPEGIYG